MMGLNLDQVCKDSSDWLQGTIHEKTIMGSSSLSGGGEPMPASSRPSMERRLRPHDDQALHCPRCDSPHTKFCYYNNYSLSQPRYFCKSCRRYWTKGGTLRNIPVGGVGRKNKRPSSSCRKSTTINDYNITHYHRQQQQRSNPDVMSPNSIGVQLSYPEPPVQFSAYPDFMFENLTSNAATSIEFMESGTGGEYKAADKFPAAVSTGGYGDDTGNTHGLAPFGDMERGMIAYDQEHYKNIMSPVDVKPRLFAFQWQDQTGCHADLHVSGAEKDGSSGYLLGLGSSWGGLINGYGSSTTNPLV